MVVNHDNHNSWTLKSILVTQEVGGELETHTCKYTTTVKKASCTTPEFTTKTCGECGASIDTVTSPVLGHTWGAWSKTDGVSTRSCSACGESQSKSVSAIDTSKSLLAIGDSLAYGTNLDNTVNGSWAKKVADSLGMSSYSNLAVPGSEVYQWYSLITGNKAPNNEYKLGNISLTKEELTQAIENAGVVAISLGSNDMSKGYLEYRTAQKIHDSLKNIVDEIHTINPDAVVVLVGYAHGVVSRLNEHYKGSDQHFIDFNSSMTATFNSDAYNGFAYYVDVSDTMSDESLIGEDRAHPIADGHQKIANNVISALGSIIDDETGNKDLVTWEGIPSYVNRFDGTAPAASIVSWNEKGSSGVLTVAPSTNKDENQLGVGSVAFPGKAIVTFRFNIPELPESGTINIFHDRTLWQSYICIFDKVNEETQETEFFASVGNQNAGNSVVKIEEDTWYDVTILFAEDEAEGSFTITEPVNGGDTSYLWLIIVIIVLCLAGGGVAVYFVMKKERKEDKNA
jgi:lysophospholipase L1-like esterase